MADFLLVGLRVFDFPVFQPFSPVFSAAKLGD
jgi:hypothetical protein